MKTKAFVFPLVLLALAAIGSCRNATNSTEFYTVTFDSNGGGEDPVYIQVKPGQTVPGYQIPEDMEHDDSSYTFTGWNTRKNGAGKEFDEDFVITGDIIVYAQWNKTTEYCMVEFDPNGGVLADEDDALIEIEKGTNLVSRFPAKPERAGYTFIEWNTRRNGNGDSFTRTTIVTVDITVYAIWEGGGSTFVAVTDITGVPATAAVNTPLTLSGTVQPAAATNQTIVWSVQSAGTTGAVISGSTLTATAAGTVTVRATIANGTAVGTNFTKDINISVTGGGGFVAVTDITGVPATAAVNTPLTLSGTVQPAAATNQTIVWSVQNAGTTGAVISGSTLTATAAGTVTVRATIANGTAAGTDFTKDYAVTVTGGDVIPAGDYTVNLSGKTVKNTTPIGGNYDEMGPKVILDLPAAFDITVYTKISIKAQFYDSGNTLINTGEPTSGEGYGKGQVKILVDAGKASYESPNPIATIQNLGKQNGNNASAGTVQCPISWTTKPAAILAQAADSSVKYIEITEITFHR